MEGDYAMKEIIISIQGLYDVYSFIEKAQAVDGDVTIRRGRYCVDAKSVLGVFSIDMSQQVAVTFPSSAVEFDQFCEQFKVDR